MKQKYPYTTGYSKNNLPYVKVGNQAKILVNIEALTFKHEPQSGFELKHFIKSMEPLLDTYTIYIIGRKPNLPSGYYFDKMADDYAEMIQNELGGSVDIMGISTGGQLCHYVAEKYPDLIRKNVIISAAYRLSEGGLENEGNAAKYYKQGKYGKAMSEFTRILDLTGALRIFMNIITPIIGRMMLGNLKYPNDFLIEVEADAEMNFLDRLKNIKVPTLILSGENDICYNKVDVETTAAGIPNCRLKLYPGYGHNLTMFNMKEVIQDMKEFLVKD